MSHIRRIPSRALHVLAGAALVLACSASFGRPANKAFTNAKSALNAPPDNNRPTWTQRLFHRGNAKPDAIPVTFSIRRGDLSDTPDRWRVGGGKKARHALYDSIRDLSGFELAEYLAQTRAEELDLLFERLRNTQLETRSLEQAAEASAHRDARVRRSREIEERLKSRIRLTALEMKMALYASLR